MKGTKMLQFRPKLGALRDERNLPRLELAPAVDLAQIEFPTATDYYSSVSKWPMYHNDLIGDCCIASAGHVIDNTSRYGEGVEKFVSSSNIIKSYVACTNPPYDPATGANDNGCYLQDVLNYWRTTGIGEHKLLAFASLPLPVDNAYSNGQGNTEWASYLKAAVSLFGDVYIAVNLPKATYDYGYGHGYPWTEAVDGKKSEGGHAINICGYSARWYEAITWGALQHIGPAWLRNNVQEIWAVITPEWVKNQKGVSPQGLNLTQLGDQFASLTGEPNPFASFAQ